MTLQKVVQRTLFGVGILALAVWACVVVVQKYSTATAGTRPISSLKAPPLRTQPNNPNNLADRLLFERLVVTPR
jgi:hypothetical protein